MNRKLKRLFKFITHEFYLDLIQIIRVYFKKPKIIFYLSEPMHEAWIKSTYDLMVENENVIIIIDRYYSTKAHLNDKKYFCINSFLLPLIKTKILVTAVSGIKNTHAPRAKWRVYMPHTPSSLHTIYPEGALDYFNVIFGCGPHHETETKIMVEKGFTTPKKFFPVGYGKLDLLLTGLKNNKKFSRPTSKKTVLIAPSWGDENIFDLCVKNLISDLISLDLFVVLRPHPLVYRKRMKEIQLIKSTYLQKNFLLEDPFKTSEALYYTDILISDFSGIAMEFAFVFKKPVLFIDQRPKIKNKFSNQVSNYVFEKEIRSLIGLVSLNNTEQIKLKLYELIRSNHNYENKISSTIKELIYHPFFSAEAAKSSLHEIDSI